MRMGLSGVDRSAGRGGLHCAPRDSALTGRTPAPGAMVRPMLGGERGNARRAAGRGSERRSYGPAKGSPRRAERRVPRWRVPAAGSTGTPVSAGKGTLVGESVWPMRLSIAT